MNGLWWPMKAISYARHRFPSDVIRHAVWLYLRFTLSYRDVEDLLAERGLEVSNESIRRWGFEVRAGDRQKSSQRSAEASQSLASGRNGGLDWRSR